MGKKKDTKFCGENFFWTGPTVQKSEFAEC